MPPNRPEPYLLSTVKTWKEDRPHNTQDANSSTPFTRIGERKNIWNETAMGEKEVPRQPMVQPESKVRTERRK